jgi:FkbM family methyltransferase
MQLLKKYNINLIFDVGANTGQFSSGLRRWGYKGRIVSFEPLPDAYNQLVQNTSLDPLWEPVNLAIGDFDGNITLHVSRNSYSSSILEMMPRHLDSAPDSAFIGSELVPIRKIDTIIEQYYNKKERLFLKIDTQGFEKKVIEGCQKTMDSIQGFQIEMSLFPLYNGETLIQEMMNYLHGKGYKLRVLEQGHYDYKTGEILQVEGIFFR